MCFPMQFCKTSKNAVLQESFCSFMFTSVARPGGDVGSGSGSLNIGGAQDSAGHSILRSCPSFSLFLVFVFLKVKLPEQLKHAQDQCTSVTCENWAAYLVQVSHDWRWSLNDSQSHSTSASLWCCCLQGWRLSTALSLQMVGDLIYIYIKTDLNWFYGILHE